MKPERGDEALRRFRVSLPHSDYFLTFNLTERGHGLTEAPTGSAIREEISAIEHAGYWRVRAAVIMPDHMHLLVALHAMLPLSRIVARLKSRTKRVLEQAGLCWQGNYYEHRLRTVEDAGPVILYIYLNPYRANLLPSSTPYPWFWLGADESVWFEPGLDNGKPFAEWLR